MRKAVLRIEVSCGGQILQLDNFRVLRGYGWKGFGKHRLWSQNKGQSACVAAFMRSIAKGQQAPIPAEQIFEISGRSIELA